MANIIPGAQFSTYKTVAISLGVSKRENNDGVKSRYIVLSVKNKKSLLSGTRRIVLFDDDLPGAFDILKAFAGTTPDANGGYLVDLAKFKADATAMSELEGLLEFPGGMVVEYQLQKGMCYQNDIDGNPVKLKGTNEVVKKDRVNVFVQVDFATVDENGRTTYTYIDRFGLNDQGQRMESRFYKKAVEAPAIAPADDAIISAQPAEEASSAAPTERPF